ncbi:hypothetical protein F2Q69_00062135 [Brassica cretica]|uniref:Uncharacterized protein n=1 Tax=Brassica cretica TaxID=69181 RepID=A0A8S9RBX4_BRACR|nr:hypothetical protein F2Q69_00062135 [Brassica cretica]
MSNSNSTRPFGKETKNTIAGQSSSSFKSLISCAQSDSKRTSLFPSFNISCIAHNKLSASAWRGDAAELNPCAPNRVGEPASSNTNPIPALSLPFSQDASV